MHVKLPLEAITEQLEHCKLQARLRCSVVGIEFAPSDELICCAFCLGEDPALAFKVFLDFVTAQEPFGVGEAEHRSTIATHPLEYLVLASGAKWVRQGDPAWNLVESPRLEKKPAVRELFDYYGTPTLLLDRGEEEVALRLDEIGLSLLEAGFGISVEDIERPYCRECTERQIKSVQRSEECGTYPERRYRCEKCKDRDMSLRLLQPAVDDQRGLHFLHNVKSGGAPK